MTRRATLVASLLLLGAGSIAKAALVFETPITWNAPGAQGWVAGGGDEDFVDQNTVPVLGTVPAYLQMRFDAPGAQIPESGSMESSAAYVQDNYQTPTTPGDWDWVYLTFDLFVDANNTAQTFFFHSTANGETWSTTLTGNPGAWTEQTVSFNIFGGWTGGADFQAALTQVDLIGISVAHFNTDTVVYYGMDNLEFRRGFATPEPGTMAMGAMVLLSATFGSRRRLRELLRRDSPSTAT